ncbi:hypothetical protein D3C74_374670 [compost metagenome]
MNKKTIEDVRDIVEMEGLAYAISDYLSHNNIEDETLASLWKEAEVSINKVAEYIGVL